MYEHNVDMTNENLGLKSLVARLADTLRSSIVYMEGCPLDYGGQEGLDLLERAKLIIEEVENEPSRIA